jgi:putative ABC transport system permease protein
MRLLKGRTFTEEDMRGTARNAIIDENLARKHFSDSDPVGQKVRVEGVDRTIVGVVGPLRDFRYPDPALGALFYPQTQYWRDMLLIVRTDGDPLSVAGAIRAQVAQLDTDQVISEMELLDTRLSNMLAPQRFSVVLLGLFAGIALILAMVGIYGLLQYNTAQQTHDIGIRMALGAGRGDVLKAILGHGLWLSLVGVALGLAGALALTRFLSHLLYGVPPTDWLTFGGVSLILVSIALLASYVPARRAAGVDPMAALRYE